MTPLFHGITVTDARLYIATISNGNDIPAEGTIRSWVNRGQVQRTRDGQIDPFTLAEWWCYQRDTNKARRHTA